jgi:hypothetical protein
MDKFIQAAGPMIFHTPDGAPDRFSVLVSEDAHGCRMLEISYKNPDAKMISQRYTLATRDHQNYLDLYEQLAQDFGMRLPRNRQRPNESNSIEIPWRTVLTQNLHEGMHYGYGDPAVLKAGDGAYYLLSTSNDAPDSFPIIKSADLVEWSFAGYVFPAGQKPAWAADGEGIADYWAPEMHEAGGEYRVYFVARDRSTCELCIGLARSGMPTGPFIPDAQPVLKNNVIDPHLFVDGKKAYLYWKEDNNEVWPGKLSELLFQHPYLVQELFPSKADQQTVSFMLALWPWTKELQPMERFLVQQVFIEAVIDRYNHFYEHLTRTGNSHPEVKDAISEIQRYMKTPMYAQELSGNGRRLIGERIRIIENDLDWEAHLVEGMWVTKQQGRYYLFYAGNDFSTDQYGIGVAIAPTPLGPFRKMLSPFLRSTHNWWAPGHPSVVNDPQDQPQLFLHAFYPGQAGYKKFRALLALPLQFEKDKVIF